MHLPSFNQLCDSALNCSEFKELFSVAASSLSLAMLCGLPLNIFECGTVCMFVHYWGPGRASGYCLNKYVE